VRILHIFVKHAMPYTIDVMSGEPGHYLNLAERPVRAFQLWRSRLAAQERAKACGTKPEDLWPAKQLVGLRMKFVDEFTVQGLEVYRRPYDSYHEEVYYILDFPHYLRSAFTSRHFAMRLVGSEVSRHMLGSDGIGSFDAHAYNAFELTSLNRDLLDAIHAGIEQLGRLVPEPAELSEK